MWLGNVRSHSVPTPSIQILSLIVSSVEQEKLWGNRNSSIRDAFSNIPRRAYQCGFFCYFTDVEKFETDRIFGYRKELSKKNFHAKQLF